jgi:single-strand DNA-binding protein
MYAKITMVGNLGKDPEIKRLDNGATTARFSVAVNKSYKRANGETVKHTDWFLVESYQAGLVTALIQPYLRKGQLVMIDGEPTIEQYTDKAGIEQRVFKVKLGPQSTIRMLGGNKDREGTESHETSSVGATGNGSAAGTAPSEDIPF